MADAPVRAKPSYPGLTRALLAARWEEARAAARARVFSAKPYGLALDGPLPVRPAIAVEMFESRDLSLAQGVLLGRFRLAHGVVDARARAPFDAKLEPALRDDLHRFGWLGPVIADGGRTGLTVARALVEDWLDRYDAVDPQVWRPDVLGPRAAAWTANARALIEGWDLVARSRFLRGCARQTRHLARTVRHAPAGPARVAAAASLAILGLAWPEAGIDADAAFEGLRRAAAEAMLPDGAAATRNGQDQLDLVVWLDRAAAAAGEAGRAIPATLEAARARARAMLPAFLHDDGRFALFQGATEGDEAAIAAALARGGDEARTPFFAPALGLARLAAGESVAFLDAGGPAQGGFAAAAHAGPLALEFGHAGRRIVVNCGAAPARGPEWAQAARRTAAHSTLTVEEADAGAFLEGEAARRLGPRHYGGRVQGSARAEDGAFWAEGTSDLYARTFGVAHRRRIWLDSDGAELRGEDRLTRPERRQTADGPLAYQIRFHLHPDQKASMAQGGDSVLIVGPGGDGWRLKAGIGATGARLGLEGSIYMGEETARRTEAAVIRAVMVGTETVMRWSLKREERPKRGRR